jgi:hypothetical protein
MACQKWPVFRRGKGQGEMEMISVAEERQSYWPHISVTSF